MRLPRSYSLRALIAGTSIVALLLAYAVNKLRVANDDLLNLTHLLVNQDGTPFDATIKNAAARHRSAKWFCVVGRMKSEDGSLADAGLILLVLEAPPPWLSHFAWLVGGEAPPLVTEVQVSSRLFDDEAATTFSELSILRSIELHNTNVTDESIRRLCDTPHLQRILLGENNRQVSRQSIEAAASKTNAHAYVPKESSLFAQEQP